MHKNLSSAYWITQWLFSQSSKSSLLDSLLSADHILVFRTNTHGFAIKNRIKFMFTMFTQAIILPTSFIIRQYMNIIQCVVVLGADVYFHLYLMLLPTLASLSKICNGKTITQRLTYLGFLFKKVSFQNNSRG